MNDDALRTLLNELRQLGIDAIHAYDQVIPNIEDSIIKARLETFGKNHQLHAKELQEKLSAIAEEQRNMAATPDIKGYILEGLAALRSIAGTRQALKALHPIEAIINRRYSDAVSQQTPAPIHDMVRKHFSDVKIHLDYIASNLEAMP